MALHPMHSQHCGNCFKDGGYSKASLLIAAGATMGLVEAIYLGDFD